MMTTRPMTAIALTVLLVAACSDPTEKDGGNPDVGSMADGGGNNGGGGNDGGRDDGGTMQPTEGPGNVLSLDDALDDSRLALDVKVDASSPAPIRSLNSEAFVVEFSFKSQTLLGHDWRHDAALFLPKEIRSDLPAGSFALVQLGTEETQNGVSDTGSFRTSYAGVVAAGLGIPVMVVPSLPGRVDLGEKSAWEGQAAGQCFVDGLPAERYTPCMLQILAATSDPEADPFRHIAFSWMRTMTLAQALAAEIREVDWGESEPVDVELEEGVILADGPRAVAARMAAAVDDRIVGVFAGGADFVDVPGLVSTMQGDWNDDYGWFNDIDAFSSWLNTDDGEAWLDTVDPARFSEMLDGKSFVLSAGTNDPIFPLRHFEETFAAFPSDTNHFLVNDYGHGIGTQFHLNAWYAFLAHVFLGEPWTVVDATYTQAGGNVAITASGEGDATVAGGQGLYVQQHRTGDDTDFRDTVWTGVSLQEDGSGGWTASIAPIVSNPAVYVMLVEEKAIPTIVDDPAELQFQVGWTSGASLLD